MRTRRQNLKGQFFCPSVSSRAITLIEMLVIIAIILLLFGLLIGGLADMHRAQRLKNSVSRVVGMLGAARNKAISDNSIYHVRLENRGPNDQWIGIYRFTEVSEALEATTEGDVQAFNPPGWYNQNLPGPGPYTNALLDKQKLDLGIYFETQYDPVKLWNSSRGRPFSQAVVHPSLADLYYTVSAPYPALAAEENLLPKTATYTSAGVLLPPATHKLLFFYPDGTASINALLFISDEEHLRWVRVWRGGMITSGDIENLDRFDDAKLQ